MNLREFVRNILKENNFEELYKRAKGVDYDTFLNKTDGVASHHNLLYRGHHPDDSLNDFSFMTDYIGHARQYGDKIEGIICNPGDVLRFNDSVFDNLRKEFKVLTKKDMLGIYLPYFKNHKLFDAMQGKYESEKSVINFVFNFIKSEIPYSKVQQRKIENDLLIPIMQHYAEKKGKNIISFVGGDYFDYGGADEYVVKDVSRYTTLKDIWSKANA